MSERDGNTDATVLKIKQKHGMPSKNEPQKLKNCLQGEKVVKNAMNNGVFSELWYAFSYPFFIAVKNVFNELNKP